MKRIATVAVVLVGGAFLLVLLAGPGPQAAAQPAAAQPAEKVEAKVEVLVGGLAIARPMKEARFGGSMAFGVQPGTRVSLFVSMPGRYILDVDRGGSTLTKFADDKGTVLGKPGKAGEFDSWMGMSAPVAEDKQSCSPEIRSEKLPAAGATRLEIDASLAILCGADAKTASVEVALAKDTAVKLGSIDAKVGGVEAGDFGDMKLHVTFSSSQKFSAIRKLTFVGADGKEIKSEESGSGWEGGGDGPTTYSVTYGLAEKLDKATVKVDYWGKVETVTVPVKLNVGLGL